MKAVQLAIVSTLVLVRAVPDLTKEEWEVGIAGLTANITAATDSRTLEEFFTDNYQGFHPGTLLPSGPDGDGMWTKCIIVGANVLWFNNNGAVVEFRAQKENKQNEWHLEHGIALVVKEDGKLKVALALWNYVN